MATPNKQHDKTLNGVNPNSAQRKQRPGTSPDQDANADYDYRPDFGQSGGGVDHNPELKTDTVQKPIQKPEAKPKDKK
jgi:hypothetical protein